MITQNYTSVSTKTRAASGTNRLASAAFLFAALLAAILAPRPAEAASALVNTQTIANLTLKTGEETYIPLTACFADPDCDTVRMTFTNPSATVDIKLRPDAAPISVANFLRYVNHGYYDGSFIHRSTKAATSGIAVVQGGGFGLNGEGFYYVPSFDPIVNESNLSNVRGTIAMARTTDPDSATNQWFVNVNDINTVLDGTTSTGYAVFGEIKSGMSFFDTVNADPVWGSETPSGLEVFQETPFHNGNLVTLTSAKAYPALTFSISNSDKKIVANSLEENRYLGLKAGVKPGVSIITVKASGSGGRTISQTFVVTVQGEGDDSEPPPGTHFDSDSNFVFETSPLPGQYAQDSINNFDTYAYPAGTPFAVIDGEISFDGKKWLKKGVVPAGATVLYIRVKGAKTFLTTTTAVLVIGGDTASFTATTGAPDLVVENIETQTSGILAEGGKFNLVLRFKNAGDAPAPASAAGIWFDANPALTDAQLAVTKPLKTVSIPKLAPGATKDITLKNVVAKSRAGATAGNQYTAPVRVLADYKGKVAERDETNNAATTSVTINRPNLVISSFVVSNATLAEDKVALTEKGKYTLEIVVKNEGPAASVASKASLWLTSDAPGAANPAKPFKTLSIPKLAAGETSKVLYLKNLVAKRVDGAPGITLTLELDRENKLVGEDKAGNGRTIQATINAAPAP